jgi:hypothetical protein
MNSRKKYKIIFEKLRETKKEQDTRLLKDIQASQEVSETINLLRQCIDESENHQITITRS